jgi:hypothetical protein
MPLLTLLQEMLHKVYMQISDTPRQKCAGFLVLPECAMPTLAVWTQEALCPQAFHGLPSVPVCPTVPAKALDKIFLAAF